MPQGADAALAAGLGIAGLAGWLPFAWRAPLTGGEDVLVLGATGSVGLVAVQTAKLLGAARVVAAGRSPAGLERAADLGADATLRLDEHSALVTAFKEAFGGDGPSYVFDPLWGEPGAAAVLAAAPKATIVNLGQAVGATATFLPRRCASKAWAIFGFSVYAVPSDVLAEHYRRLVDHAVAGPHSTRCGANIARIHRRRVAASGRGRQGKARRRTVGDAPFPARRYGVRSEDASGLLVARSACVAARSQLPRAPHDAQALRSLATAITASISGSSPPSIQAASIVSPSRIRNAERTATSCMPSGAKATSNARIASPFQSERSGTSTPSVCAHARCDQSESREIAYGRIPAAARSSPLSRRSTSSFVQVVDQS